MRAAAVCLAVGLAGATAHAHDSWLEARGSGAGRSLAFVTGNRYPLGESAPAPQSVVGAACAVGGKGGKPQALRAVRPSVEQPLLLRGPSVSAAQPLGCWAELAEHQITLAPPLVDVYLRETRPGAEVVQRWAGLLERGQPWVERYRKFARIELASADGDAETRRAIRAPAGLPLEIVVLGDDPLRAGSPARFRVLADGQPLAGLAVELVSSRNPLGVWLRSDADGALEVTPPFAGDWLLRATWIRADGGEGWNSRFVTLAFAVGAQRP